jgi:CDP-paratose 2-epimerase
MATVLVTGGAGFVGSNLASAWKRDEPGDRVVSLDNLLRAGSELAPARLAAAGVAFVRGDVRRREDLEAVGPFDLLIDCAAEPSVQAGYDGDTRPLIDTNLTGTLNCLDLARARGARVVFLSSSRVYPIAALRALPLRENETRLDIPEETRGPGWSKQGISTEFPLNGHRSLYGATKLASELFVQEYAAAYGLEAVVNRLGVIAGPWQMGKVDQGFVALWAAQYLYGGCLAYNGFGGLGKQVRDVLHVEDVYALIRTQLSDFKKHAGRVYNAGGGAANAVSLRELSALCETATGQTLNFSAHAETHPADIPWYVTDNTEVTRETGWAPRKSVPEILADTVKWLTEHKAALAPLLRRPSVS